jgi:beta-glucosidase
LKELKHFTKLSLKPGETKEVKFTIAPDDLKFFDDTRREWIAEPGKFKAYIGASSTDIRSEVVFTLR